MHQITSQKPKTKPNKQKQQQPTKQTIKQKRKTKEKGDNKRRSIFVSQTQFLPTAAQTCRGWSSSGSRRQIQTRIGQLFIAAGSPSRKRVQQTIISPPAHRAPLVSGRIRDCAWLEAVPRDTDAIDNQEKMS